MTSAHPVATAQGPIRSHRGCSTCFYCDAALSVRHEHDHFPVPAAVGGKDVVPACVNCHDLKDRVSLWNWPEDLVRQSIWELIQAGPQYESAPTVEDFVAGVSDWRKHWPVWTVAGRLLYAKGSAMVALADVVARVNVAKAMYAAGESDIKVLAQATGLARRIVRANVISAA